MQGTPGIKGEKGDKGDIGDTGANVSKNLCIITMDML